MNSSPPRNRRALQTDPLSGFLPPGAIVMVSPEAAQEGDLEFTEIEKVVFPRTPSSLLFFVAAHDLEAPGARDLLSKMISALGLSESTTRIEELQADSQLGSAEVDFGGNLVVAMGEEAALQLGLVEDAGARALVTHSLSALLSDPALKRESWQHLQMAAREAGWQIPTRG